MTRITAAMRGFAIFWWDFIVGDDWRIAAVVIASLAATAVLATTRFPAWWLLPVTIPTLLLMSLRQVTRSHH
jgi:hypothetical protein